MRCAGCAADIGPSLLACPTCHTLVHRERLKTLAHEAAAAGARGDVSAQLAAWREALSLLPPESSQHATIFARVNALSIGLIDGVPAPASAAASAASSGSWASASISPSISTPTSTSTSASTSTSTSSGSKNLWTSGGAVTGLLLLLWKFKAVLVFVLTKGKLLLLGLTKSSTLFTMIPSLGLYWAVFGWRFAAGLVGSIYIHEMGHVAALTRFGIAASAPMFIPGVGAVIRSRAVLTNPREEARVGLAGPIWGLAAAAAAFGMYLLTRSPIWAVIGHFGAWVNLFNLIPVWQLDGAHAFKAMKRAERWLATAAIAAIYLATREGLLVLVAILAGVQAVRQEDHPEGDTSILLQFIALVAVLAWMSTIPTPPLAR